MPENEYIQKEFFQPEYFNLFKCDGQKCNAHCCRKWRIDIDKKTYKKYSHLKPKSTAKEIIRHIIKREGIEEYAIKLNENLSCPFLTEDNWCKIQREYGEDFLSSTCKTYPRRIWDFGFFIECSLTLTCPIVAEMVLLSKEPLKFEKGVVSEKNLKSLKNLTVFDRKVPDELYTKCISIQETAISILQERNLTIDQRLMMLGLYIDKTDDLWANVSLIDDIDKVNAIYQKSDFLLQQADQFSQVIKFNGHNYIKSMLEILQVLYGEANSQDLEDQKMLEVFQDFFQIKPNDQNELEINPLVIKYSKLKEERQNFTNKFSTIFENYLVNEFFLNVYPFKIQNTSMTYSYSLFVTIYKILELLTFASAMKNNSTEEDLVKEIMWYVSKMDHNLNYAPKIHDYLRDKSDMVEVMQNMLQV